MKYIFLLLLFLLNLSAFAQDTKELVHLLDIDRFHAYVQRWGSRLTTEETKPLAKAMMEITPAEFSKMKIPAAKLADAFEYDDLILEILNKKLPSRGLKKADIEWNYNFYKRKLNEAYQLGAPPAGKPVKSAIVEVDKTGTAIKNPVVEAEEILLNVDGYASSRTTRAVFWEASKSGRQIEFHVGTAADFKLNLAERGAKVIGQIKTLERNYNPIYVIQVAGEKEYRYAVTEISGANRLQHFTLQAELMKWQGGTKVKSPVMSVVGDATATLLAEEKALTSVLQNVPTADKVIIGQKGAIERTIAALGKNKAIVDLATKNLNTVEKTLSPEMQKVLTKVMSGETPVALMGPNQLSSVEKLYDAVEPLFEKLNVPKSANATVFNLDRGSYEVSDYMLEGTNGKLQRWRVFSNSWGDEVLPVARALKATGHKDIIYIGTAGALPHSGLSVGDLVIPKKALDQSGELYEIQHGGLHPKNVKFVDGVTNVASPFEETNAWLAGVKENAQVVEIETSYLAQTFNGRGDKFSPYLLISDVVGVEGETLAEASSSSRRNAQFNVLSSIFEDAGIKTPVTGIVQGENKLAQWMDELVPNRDPVSRFQVLREAQEQDLTSKAQLKKLLESETAFTTTRLENTLIESGRRFEALLNDAGNPKLSISSSFLEGRWNPTKGPIEIHLQVASQKGEADLLKVLQKLKSEDKQFAKFLNVSVSQNAANSNFVRLPKLPESSADALMVLYKDSALGFGGLAHTQTRTGSLKFVQVGPGTTGKATSSQASFVADELPNKQMPVLGKGKACLANSPSCKCIYEALNGLMQ